jgi:hypothetical protein
MRIAIAIIPYLKKRHLQPQFLLFSLKALFNPNPAHLPFGNVFNIRGFYLTTVVGHKRALLLLVDQ